MASSSGHVLKNIIVTGANTGIGLETARLLAHQHKVFLACRSKEKADVAIADIIKTVPSAQLEFLPLDLGDLRSVRDCAASFIEKKVPLNVLLLNAGVSNGGKTAQGYELMFGVNHLGHFLLTKLLLPKLRESAPSRIVVVSSSLHSSIKDKNINIEGLPNIVYPLGTGSFHGYSVSKMLNVWFTHSLARQLQGTEVTVNSLHPGVVQTELQRSLPWWISALFWPIKKIFFITPLQGARTSVYLATDEHVQGVSGKYFADSAQKEEGVLANDEGLQQRLWDLSEKLTAEYTV